MLLEEVWVGFSPPWGGSGLSAARAGGVRCPVPVPRRRHRDAGTRGDAAETVEPVGPRGFVLLGFMQL